MAEATSTPTEKKTPTGKPRKAAKKKAAPAPLPDTGYVSDWRTWGIAGAILVFGVIGWKLLNSTYKHDVRTICEGEGDSGFTLEKDQSKVTAYVRQHLTTPEGNTFYSSLSDAKLVERAKRLKGEASAQGIASCPAVAAYEKMAAEGDYRADLQHLCSIVAFSHLAEADDAGRLQRLEDWIDQGARSPRTKDVGDALRQGATGADRAKVLRDAAFKVDIFTCDLAKTLEGPVMPAKGKGPPMVRPFGAPQIIGVLKPEDVAKPLVDATPAMNECYKKGLDRKPDLEGKLAIKMRVDPSGKVTNVSPADETLPDRETAMCILQVVRSMEFPKNAGPLVSIFLPLELTTSALPTSPIGVPPPPAALAAPTASAASSAPPMALPPGLVPRPAPSH
ncbi:MAG: AgmX/PglI C-terminal domain-containing protein [Polyangiaceae bacterium]|jgi:hypothetical protein